VKPVELADVGVGAVLVVGVEAQEGNEGEAVVAPVPAIAQLCGKTRVSPAT